MQKFIFVLSMFCITLLSCGGEIVEDFSQQSQKNRTIQAKNSENLIDLNSASISEIEKLPGIGEKLARRIVEHREKFGRFKRAEHVIVVKGMSDKKYRKISHLITAK
ncbi:MAG: helix-hairpin-helix domain-containing protein [Acidobacteria bacterium]|jgi:competence protein ComEA|nr:MAG: helix-hairpin-helix domain-containing protein [Acidobacteriota bacterium]GIU82814.1 MAG: hypothetical protein KatS3mg006_1878 [Pyrinomonadaceae bacterium]